MRRKDILLRFALLIVLALVVYLLNPNFGRLANLINILRQGAILYVLAIGMTLVILTGGIDLSNGAVLALSSCVAAMAMKAEVPVVWGVLIALAIGATCGLINGAMVSYLEIPPFIATFAMMYFARGMAYILLKGRIVYSFDPGFRFIATGMIAGVPMPVILSLFLLLVFWALLEYTPLGVNIYAVGADAESSRLTGISVTATRVTVYVLSGLLSAFAGLIYTARLNAAEPVVGASFPLDAIAAVIIGGASLAGGEGNLLGSAFGVLILTVIINGMNLLGISSLWQQFVIGAIVLIIITAQHYTRETRLIGHLLRRRKTGSSAASE
jgi:ribose transport system permease protein